MELLLGIVVVVAVGALIYFNRSAKSADINQDGKIDLADAAQAVENATQGVKTVAKKAAVKAKTATRSAAKKPAPKRAGSKTTKK